MIWLASEINLTQVVDVDDVVRGADEDVRHLRERLQSGYSRQIYLDGGTIAELVQRRLQAGANVADQTNALALMTDENDVKQVQMFIDLETANIARIDARLANVAGWASYERIRGASIGRARKCSPARVRWSQARRCG